MKHLPTLFLLRPEILLAIAAILLLARQLWQIAPGAYGFLKVVIAGRVGAFFAP